MSLATAKPVQVYKVGLLQFWSLGCRDMAKRTPNFEIARTFNNYQKLWLKFCRLLPQSRNHDGKISTLDPSFF